MIAITPNKAKWQPWTLAKHSRIDQGYLDLGRRMTKCLRRLATPYAVIIGSDIPDITTTKIFRAFSLLKRVHFVFGPSSDGGYWCIGWRRSRWPYGALTHVRWSSPYALDDSIKSIRYHRSIRLLDRLDDIDTLEDFQRWHAKTRVTQFR